MLRKARRSRPKIGRAMRFEQQGWKRKKKTLRQRLSTEGGHTLREAVGTAPLLRHPGLSKRKGKVLPHSWKEKLRHRKP